MLCSWIIFSLVSLLEKKRDVVELIGKPCLHHFPPASFVAMGHKVFEVALRNCAAQNPGVLKSLVKSCL